MGRGHGMTRRTRCGNRCGIARAPRSGVRRHRGLHRDAGPDRSIRPGNSGCNGIRRTRVVSTSLKVRQHSRRNPSRPPRKQCMAFPIQRTSAMQRHKTPVSHGALVIGGPLRTEYESIATPDMRVDSNPIRMFIILQSLATLIRG